MDALVTTYRVVADAIQGLVDGPLFLLAIWLLALVFGWSGTVKVREPELTALALVDLGLVKRARRKLGLAAGGCELAIAFGLVLFGAISAVPLMIATAVLVAFSLLLLRVVRSDADVPCFCFGDSKTPASWRTFGRTAGLALYAAMASARFDGGVAPVLPLEIVLAATAAVGLVMSSALATRLSRLLRWNGSVARGAMR